MTSEFRSPNTRVLVVEDDSLIAMSMERELENAGFEVVKIVSRGEEVADLVREDTPDLILMDIGLAGPIDGIDAAHQVQQFSNVPIIIMTGYVGGDVEERVALINPLAFLEKPLTMNTLLPLIGSVRRE